MASGLHATKQYYMPHYVHQLTVIVFGTLHRHVFCLVNQIFIFIWIHLLGTGLGLSETENKYQALFHVVF